MKKLLLFISLVLCATSAFYEKKGKRSKNAIPETHLCSEPHSIFFRGMKPEPGEVYKGHQAGFTAECEAMVDVHTDLIITTVTANGKEVFNDSQSARNIIPKGVMFNLNHYYDVPSDAEAGHWEMITKFTDMDGNIIFCAQVIWDFEE